MGKALLRGTINGVNLIQNPNAGIGGAASSLLQIRVICTDGTTYNFTDDVTNGAEWPIGGTVTIEATPEAAPTTAT